MNRLTEIANKYNTDKGTCTSCDNGAHGHGFTEFYYDYFNDLKKPVILEIGVYKGNSIRTLNEFFNGDCEIYCIDIDESCKFVEEIGDNIHFYLLDQGDERQLKGFASEIGGKVFDIIIDDGSHHIDHQMLTYSVFRKFLKPDGMYIMEDLHTSYTELHFFNTDVPTTTLDFFVNFTPYYKFSPEQNLELLSEIKTVTLFSNDDNVCPKTIGNLRRNRSLTAIIRLHQDAEA